MYIVLPVYDYYVSIGWGLYCDYCVSGMWLLCEDYGGVMVLLRDCHVISR